MHNPMPSSRGPGTDRRPIITIDGRTYTRQGRAMPPPHAEPPATVQDLILDFLQGLGFAMVLGAVATLVVCIGPDLAHYVWGR